MTDLSETHGQELPEFLRYEETLIANTGVDAETLSPFVFPEDPDEETYILFKMSQRQYTAILSSVDTGSIICYGAGAMQVYWWFVRNTELAMPFCEQIINCINTDADTRDTIINMLLADETFMSEIGKTATSGKVLPPTEVTKPLIDNCNEDQLFGAVSYIVRQMNAVNEDVFEIIEVHTNEEEKISALLEAIPILGELPIGDIITMAEQILETISENYSGQYTTELEDELRCGLFCLAQNNDCKLTIATVYDYFAARVDATITLFGSFQEAVDFIADGTWTGTQIVDIMMFFQVVTLINASEFLGITLKGLELQAALGANNPDNDWAILPCPDCPPDGECIEFIYDTSLGIAAGTDTGAYAFVGDLVEITADGNYLTNPGPGYGSHGVKGFPSMQAPYVSPDVFVYGLMIKIEGETTWRAFDVGVDVTHGTMTFTAPVSGKILTTVNEGIGVGDVYTDNVGSFTLEVCVDSAPIELVVSGAQFEDQLEPISQTGNEIVYEVTAGFTGHYTVFAAFEKNNTQFYVKSVQIIDSTPEWDSNVVGLGVLGITALFPTDEIPNDFAATHLSLERVTEGKRIRFTLTTVAGDGTNAPRTGP